MLLWSALDRALLPDNVPDRVALCRPVADILVALPLGRPRQAVAELPDHAAVVAVVDHGEVPDDRPHVPVQHALVVELVQVGGDAQQPAARDIWSG